MMRPPVTTKPSGSSRMIASAVMLLPQPDSPTSATVRALSRVNDRFSSTGTRSPSRLVMLTLRFSTDNTGAIITSAAAAD